MRKVLYTAAALLLCAAPVRAQALATTDPAPAAPVAAATEAKAERTPSLFPTTDEVRRHVADAEARRAEAPLGSRDWWYLVAAIAIGVILVVVLLD